jgi:D-alanine-D-alanine ligase
VIDGSGDRVDAVARFQGRHRLDPRLISGKVDVAFPVLHGPFGEDGSMQGLLEVLGLPYVGCDHYASAVCMDKGLTKRILAHGGLPTPPWVEVTQLTWHRQPRTVTERCLDLELPLFVKPARLGSSVGISKVVEAGQLQHAIEHALSHDRRVVVEHGLDAREIEVPVLGNLEPQASLPGEVVPGHEFYDYDDKYVDSDCELLAPAPITEDEQRRARDLAVTAFRLLGCEGMARVDLFLERSTGELWVNEVNTIPGFTSISMYPKLWSVTGIAYPELIERLIRLAIDRHQRRRLGD